MTAPVIATSVQEDGNSFRSFEDIKRTRPDGSVYWSARDLMPLLGYSKWQDFKNSIERAKVTSFNIGHETESAFELVIQLMDAHNLGKQERVDFYLSRFAAYLVAMNGDPRKPEVAAAQAYFAIQTHFAEAVQQGQLVVAGSGADELGAKFDKTLSEFRRVVTPATLESPAASALAEVLRNLSRVMLPLPAARYERPKDSISSSRNGKPSHLRLAKPSVHKSRAGEIPETVTPFSSQAGKHVSRGYRERYIPISEEADTPVTYQQFVDYAALEHCGRCGQALSHRMTALAQKKGIPAGRFASKNVFPLDFWIEAWDVLSEHLGRLHADHERNHEER